MPIPDYQSLMLPIIRLSSDGLERRARDAASEIATQLGLSEEELSLLTPSGSDFVFSNRIGWARAYLKKAGLIKSTSFGKFQITDDGRSLLDKNPAKIDLALLKTYPSFREWWSSSRSEGERVSGTEQEAPPTKETPEELIASTHRTLRKHLESELLARVSSGSPEYFERLVVKLLTTIGYGGSLVDAGQAIGRSRDGGIDGVIKEDKLGLDLIYIQAKRWGTNTVGAPDVQGFVGALAGKKARKGVFITTSKFSRDAIAYASSLENSVILIDGERLSELMFEYGLGVATINSYQVKRIDNDFFDEDDI